MSAIRHIVLLLWLAAGSGEAALRQLQSAVEVHCGAPECGSTAPPITSIEVGARLVGQGMHRLLRYVVTARCSQGSGSGGSSAPPAAEEGQYEVALLQGLPAGIFADPYQLENAAAAGRGPRVMLFGPIDLESIETTAVPTALAVYGNLTLLGRSESRDDGCGSVASEVEVHARHPVPQLPTGTSPWQRYVASPLMEHVLPPPVVLVRQGVHGPLVLSRWARLPTTGGDRLSWRVPAGNLLHAWIAPAVTAASVLIGAASVLAALGAAPAADKAASSHTAAASRGTVQ